MVPECRPLIEVLAEIPDVRHARGKRHPLPAILALVSVAFLCGYRSYNAAAPWARIYPREFVAALGFSHPTPPCAATLCTVLGQIDRAVFEAKLTAWSEAILAQMPAAPGDDDGVAVDGKTLRGSRRQGAPQTHLLSALSHRLGLTLNQHAVDDKTNEITVVVPLLRSLLVEGRVFTMDALLTQRAMAQAIIDGHGDYLMLVKDNQPTLRADIELVFTNPPQDDLQAVAETTDRGHGRIEQRRLTVSSALADYSDWPGLEQVVRIERSTVIRTTGVFRAETVYGLTSLDGAPATPERLLGLSRAHWSIENRSHWVRDVTFDEDHSQVRKGSTPQVLAALRNVAIGLLRLKGETNIAAAGRRLAAQPHAALALLGIMPDN
jgi:predicted transposase YbfD/YdcC